MNIGAAAESSGVSAKMIRHYEAIGLMPAAPRRANAYRDYGPREINELRFIARARRLGFAVDDIRNLLGLWRDDERPSRDVRKIASAHLATVEARIKELEEMARALRHLVGACRGDERPSCPILEDLAATKSFEV